MRVLFVLLSGLLLLGACSKTLPIYNVTDGVVFTGSGKEPSREQVRKAIVQAIVAKTWRMKDIDTSHIQASLVKKNKVATIIIEYSTKFYRINYQDSTLLLYTEGRIHRRYNAWIRGLRITIDRNLALL